MGKLTYNQGGFEPFALNINEIDYVKDMEQLIKLLSIVNMKMVYFDVQNYGDKEKIMGVLREKGLDKKIRINVIPH